MGRARVEILMRLFIAMMALLTPGLAAAAPCEMGDLVISEIMAGPRSNQYDEYVEVHALNSCEANTCELTYQRDGSDDKVADVTPEGGLFTFAAGSYSLFSGRTNSSADEGITLAYRYTDGTVVVPDAFYSSGTVRLSTNTPGTVVLSCDDVVLDSAPSWLERFDSTVLDLCSDGVGRGGCAEVVKDNALDDVSNDDLDAWCVAGGGFPVTLERELTNPEDKADGGLETFTLYGTPGRASGCANRDWPEPNAVRFTEVFVAPGVVPEFIELVNRTDGAVDVADCELVSFAYEPETDAEDAPLVLTEDDRVPLIDPGEGIVLQPQGIAVLTSGGDCLDEGIFDCQQGELAYPSGLSFPNDGYRLLILECPTPLTLEPREIDRVVLDMPVQGVPSGQSVMLDPAYLDEPAGTDDATIFSRWCAAGYDNCFAFDEDGECDAGTPFSLSECPTIQYPDAPFPCRCSTPSGRPPFWLVAALTGLIGLRRNRR